MTTPPRWELERYLPLLRAWGLGIKLDPRLQWEWSDLVSETLLRAHACMDQFRGETEGELVGWLKEILDNRLKDRVRAVFSRKRNVNLERSLHAAVDESSQWLEKVAAEQSTPSGQAEDNEMMVHLAEALEALPEAQRTAFIQRERLGASIAEIAENMKRTEKSVAGLLRQARLKLRKRMDKFR